MPARVLLHRETEPTLTTAWILNLREVGFDYAECERKAVAMKKMLKLNEV